MHPRVARRVSGRFVGPYRDDLLDEAAGEVWKAIAGFRPGSAFEPWCYQVLRNHLIDQVRKDERERMHQATLAVRAENEGLQAALEQALDRQDRFAADDLAVLRTWPLPQRLMVLSLSGLWQKVPHGEWGSWVAEYRATRDGDLPEPFPPDQLQICEDLVERNGILAEAMKVRRNTLSVWLYRYKGRLRDLQYVRDLLGNL